MRLYIIMFFLIAVTVSALEIHFDNENRANNFAVAGTYKAEKITSFANKCFKKGLNSGIIIMIVVIGAMTIIQHATNFIAKREKMDKPFANKEEYIDFLEKLNRDEKREKRRQKLLDDDELILM